VSPGPATDVLRLARARVFVAGDALLDVYLEGDVSRVSPEAPVPVLLETGSRRVLGGAANVAANVAALGGRATLAARVGDDPEGDDLRALCAERGIDTALVCEPGLPTPRKTRVVAAGFHQLARLDRERTDPLASDAQQRVLDAFATWDGGALVLADYAKGALPEPLTRRLVAAARRRAIPVVADPKAADLSRYAGATVIKPNRGEAQSAAQGHGGDLLDAVLRASGAENVVLSLSAEGVAVRGAAVDGTVERRSEALEVADVSGAGDTMVAVLAMGLAAGLELTRAVELANAAAGAVCGKPGTATVTPAELLDAVHGASKILRTHDDAAAVAHRLRAAGRRLVLANGCFDLLHAGHVRLLQHARSLGDALMVALNDDDSVRRLKGPGRPRQPLRDRLEILAALEAVDHVVAFAQDTPLELLRAVRPDVLVKGGDYRPEDVVGAGVAGEVVIVPLLDGRSTTALLRAL
jgi:D-beta-D-heptose 7-phosphate kinase / D-beta-D-heptose 1-phosphate adenosyltransferase